LLENEDLSQDCVDVSMPDRWPIIIDLQPGRNEQEE